jgi:hypothetical protein
MRVSCSRKLRPVRELPVQHDAGLKAGGAHINPISRLINLTQMPLVQIGIAHQQSDSRLRQKIDSSAERFEGKPKFKYLLPLDEEVAARVKPLTKIYPKRAASRDIAAPDLQSGEAGEAPSAALQ